MGRALPAKQYLVVTGVFGVRRALVNARARTGSTAPLQPRKAVTAGLWAGVHSMLASSLSGLRQRFVCSHTAPSPGG